MLTGLGNQLLSLWVPNGEDGQPECFMKYLNAILAFAGACRAFGFGHFDQRGLLRARFCRSTRKLVSKTSVGSTQFESGKPSVGKNTNILKREKVVKKSLYK